MMMTNLMSSFRRWMWHPPDEAERPNKTPSHLTKPSQIKCKPRRTTRKKKPKRSTMRRKKRSKKKKMMTSSSHHRSSRRERGL